jgi:antitoxin MazE
MAQLKLRKTGNSLSTTWPKELLSRLNVKEGDRLFVIETRHGIMVTPYDPEFERTMQNADEVIERFKQCSATGERAKHAYKVLADR